MFDFGVFIILLLGLIFWNYRKREMARSEVGYLLANRNTGFWALVATLVMTEFNPSTLVAFSGAGYGTGVWGLLLPFVFLVGLLFYTFTVAAKWKQLNAASVAELFTRRYDKKLGKLASILLLLAMFGFTANYIKSMQILFQPLFPDLSSILLSLIILLIILILTLQGGLFAIIQTDVFSFIGTLVFIPLLLFFSLKSSFHADSFLNTIPISEGSKALPFPFIVSLIILTMFTYIAAPWYGQKIFSARTDRIAFFAVGLASLLVFLLYAFPLLAVYSLKIGQMEIGSGESGVGYIVNKLFPVGIRGFAYLVLFCAGVTTLSGVWSAMTTMVITDLLERKIEGQENSTRGIKITLGISAISFILSITFIDKILDKLILANIPIAALSFGLLAGFYWKKASYIGTVVSIFVGFSWGVFCYFFFGESGMYTWYWAIYGIPLIFGTGILFSYLFPPDELEQAKINEFYKKESI